MFFLIWLTKCHLHVAKHKKMTKKELMVHLQQNPRHNKQAIEQRTRHNLEKEFPLSIYDKAKEDSITFIFSKLDIALKKT